MDESFIGDRGNFGRSEDLIIPALVGTCLGHFRRSSYYGWKSHFSKLFIPFIVDLAVYKDGATPLEKYKGLVGTDL